LLCKQEKVRKHWIASEMTWVRPPSCLPYRWYNLKLIVLWKSLAGNKRRHFRWAALRALESLRVTTRHKGKADENFTTEWARRVGRDGWMGPQGWMEVTDVSIGPGGYTARES